MRVLLDTSYLYNLMAAREQFSDTERLILANQAIQLYVSAVSIWEIRLKLQARGRIGEFGVPFEPGEVVAVLEEQDVTFLPMTIGHAARRLETPIPHRDPFDEMLLVQAQEEGLKLLTADRQMADHPLAMKP